MNSVIFEIGNFSLRWYSILVLLGAILAWLFSKYEGKRFGIPESFMLNMFFFLIPISIIGARIYYVLFNLDYYKSHVSEIFMTWNGGLAIHGGIIFGLIWILIYTKKYKIKTLRMTDILVVGLLIAQVIGRWGNFMNSEAYGPICSLEFLKSLHLPNFIIEGMFIDGFYREPTFLYESILSLIGVIVILIFRRRPYTKIGETTALYLIWYGITRFFVESLRTDSLMLSNFKVAQIVSIIMIIIGVIIFVKKEREPKLENRYNDMELIENVKF